MLLLLKLSLGNVSKPVENSLESGCFQNLFKNNNNDNNNFENYINPIKVEIVDESLSSFPRQNTCTRFFSESSKQELIEWKNYSAERTSSRDRKRLFEMEQRPCRPTKGVKTNRIHEEETTGLGKSSLGLDIRGLGEGQSQLNLPFEYVSV